jgi:hypothetical protein
MVCASWTPLPSDGQCERLIPDAIDLQPVLLLPAGHMPMYEAMRTEVWGLGLLLTAESTRYEKLSPNCLKRGKN